MLNLSTNALTDKHALRPAVRNAVKAEIKGITIELAGGRTVKLESKGDGYYFAPVAKCTDVNVNAKVQLTITVNDYIPPKPRTIKSKADAEPIVVSYEDEDAE